MNSTENNEDLNNGKEKNSKKKDSNIYYKSLIDNINDMVSSILPKHYINVIAEKLNVRSGPCKNYGIINTLKYGDVVKVQSKVKYWTEILYKDIENDILIEGWVYTKYLEKFDIELLNDEP